MVPESYDTRKWRGRNGSKFGGQNGKIGTFQGDSGDPLQKRKNQAC